MDAVTAPPVAVPAGLTPIGTASRSHTLRVIEDQRRFRPHIYWYMSFRCNLACKHCSVFSSPWVDTSEDLSTEECMRVVDEMADLNVGFAILTGGEVLLRPDALQIMAALAERGIPVGLETNGLRFDDAFVELARDLQRRKMLQIAVSLDGGTAETHERLRGPHSFRRTVHGLRMIAAHGVQFSVQCVLNRANVETIPQLYELGSELHPQMSLLQFSFLNPVGRGIELTRDLGLSGADIRRCFDLIGEHKGGYPGQTLIKGPPAMVPPQHLALVFQNDGIRNGVSCQFPLLGVLPNGDVTICAVSRDNQDLFFGNVREVSLKDVWQRTRMDMLRSRYAAAEHLDGICADCVWKYKCKGGCRAWAYQEGESFDAPLPICKKMDEDGEFPQAYRISHQNEVMTRKFQEMGGACACH
ncbi:MAG TPA: radical SAM protein [Longimicrobiaceae bacterium]